jgi:peroxiredoxin family protein
MSNVRLMNENKGASPEPQVDKRGCTFICSRNTIDGAYPALLLAINARRMGLEATIFYTFMGLDLVKKGGAEKCQFIPQGAMGAIPGMSSMATKIMKKKIDDANIPTVAELMEMAPLEGVRLVACKMTMDMMGLEKKDLIDGAEVQTAEEYMKHARNCQINMFT